MALTIGEGTIISEGVVLQGHTVERLAATFVPTTCVTLTEFTTLQRSSIQFCVAGMLHTTILACSCAHSQWKQYTSGTAP